jgi:hypothetical protein
MSFSLEMRAFLLLGLALLNLSAASKTIRLPSLIRVYPLGGQAGTSVQVETLGDNLANATSVEFDCKDLVWISTTYASSGKVTGLLSISSQAAPGPHMFRVVTKDGYSTSAMFNVGQFPSVSETEPNDKIEQAQRIEKLPVEIQGRLDGAADIDQYAVQARAGERWVFDLRSIEQGSAVEARMYLLDALGRRLAFNDDRDDFNENPLIDHTFDRDGIYYIKLDQYRGPRGFNFGKNCSYTLRISSLPTLRSVSPLGLQTGRTTKIRLRGTALGNVEKVYLTEARRAEYARMTYPYTMPIHFLPDPPTALEIATVLGKILSRHADMLELEFKIPAETRPGLWRLWAAGSKGISDGVTVEISNWQEYDENTAARADWSQGAYAVNGLLSREGEKDVYRIQGLAGRTLHFWTLAAQLGVPHLDSVIKLSDGSGKKLAENDDVVAGQGTLIGNPDSSLFYTPQQDGPLLVSVFDRLNRGGPDYSYRLKVRSEKPGFEIFTTPENLTLQRGGEGDIRVHMVRETGFTGEVLVWFEGMPAGVEVPRGKFRADQLFEPNADGADMIIPEITFRIKAPESLASGTYPIRVVGVAATEEKSPGRQLVEAQTTMIMGPLLDAWNFVRRPLPNIAMTVCEPFEASLSAHARTISLEAGKSSTLELTAEHIPEKSEIELKDLPSGIRWHTLGREGDQITLMIQASPETPAGTYDVSAQVKVAGKWASSETIALSVQAPRPTWTTKN